MAEHTTKMDGSDEVTPEQAEITQLNARIAVSDERIRELAGYQAEVRDLRDSVASLTDQLETVSKERDQAVRDAAQAQAAASSATASASTDQAHVGYAQQLAQAVKGLLS